MPDGRLDAQESAFILAWTLRVGTGVVDEWNFEAIEIAARFVAMRVAARVLEQRLNADTSDYAGPKPLCACGQSVRYESGILKKTKKRLTGFARQNISRGCCVLEPL